MRLLVLGTLGGYLRGANTTFLLSSLLLFSDAQRMQVPSSMMNSANYRVRFLLDLFRTFVLPTVLLSFGFFIFHYSPGLFSIPLHLIFFLSWVVVRGAYSESCQNREAKSLGAKPIPQVVGKWPGNIDLLFSTVRAFNTSYVLDVYLQLFEEYQCTTLNLRILWRDSVSTTFRFFK